MIDLQQKHAEIKSSFQQPAFGQLRTFIATLPTLATPPPQLKEDLELFSTIAVRLNKDDYDKIQKQFSLTELESIVEYVHVWTCWRYSRDTTQSITPQEVDKEKAEYPALVRLHQLAVRVVGPTILANVGQRPKGFGKKVDNNMQGALFGGK